MRLSVLAVLVGGMVTACSGGGFTVEGDLTLRPPTSGGITVNGDECRGTPGTGLDDLVEGAKVDVTWTQHNDGAPNDPAEVVASGVAEAGTGSADECVFDFKVANVPDKGSDGFYQVLMADRGAFDFYSVADLKAKGAHILISFD